MPKAVRTQMGNRASWQNLKLIKIITTGGISISVCLLWVFGKGEGEDG